LNDQWPLARRGNYDGVVKVMHDSGVLRDLRVWVCPSDRQDGGTGGDVVIADEIDDFASNPQGRNIPSNCSYMYVAGLNDRMELSASEAVVLLDESNDREDGSVTPGNMPDIGEDDNHGDDYRNVLYFDGSVRAIEGPDVANAVIFPEDDPWMIGGYGPIQSID
jgi:prepilin-type processing-associated H-X9-DG protein